jgi:hypothetical protein
MTVLTRPEQGYRVDHQSYAPEIWVGLFITALYLIQGEPIIGGITDWIEMTVNVLLALGSGLCLIGAALGSRWFMPETPKRRSYRFLQAGLPLIIISLAWFSYAAATSGQLVLIALGGALGLCIEIGSVRMMIDIVEDLSDEEL